MTDYQLIVIGAGPGGYTAALKAAKLGLKTAVIEKQEAGGTCLNRGCVPTKALLHASEIYKESKKASVMGIYANPEFKLREMFDYKNNISKKLSEGIEGLFKAAKVAYIKGTAKIMLSEEAKSPFTVLVGENSYTAEKILIATGSVPAMPPIPGLNLPGVLTSDTLLEGADELYSSLVIIGGGVIGVELASFYADLGCKVTIVEGLDRLLPNMDKELGQNLALLLKKQGVEIFTGAMVQRVEEDSFGMKVVFNTKQGETSVAGEKVLCAIGRSPFSEGLFEGQKPKYNRRSLLVDENFETSIKGIYAIGDVSSKIQLAHVAAAQGTYCVEKLCGINPTVDLSIIPSCIYCHPEIASVGLTEAEAKAAGILVKVGKCVMGANARTLISDPGRCFMKVVASLDGKILGAQLMCNNASDMISQISSAIANKLTPEDLLKAMKPHPTYEEALQESLLDLMTKLKK